MNTKQLRQKILDLAIRGKLVPQDPNDEPAETKNMVNEQSSFDLPETWIWTKLSDVCEPQETKRPVGDTFRYIDIESIDNKRHCVSEPKTLATAKAPSRAAKGVCSGDTLFSMVRPYLENIAFVTDKLNDCIVSTGFYVCRPRKNILFPRYLYTVLTSRYAIDGINSYMRGDNSPAIRKNEMDGFTIPLPPLAEQQRIVTAIESAFAVIDEIERNKADLQSAVIMAKQKILSLAIQGKLVPQCPEDEPIMSVLGKSKVSNVESPFDLQDGWAWYRLYDIGKIVGGGTPNTNESSYWNGDISWITPADLSGYANKFILEGSRKITSKGLSESSAKLMPAGSVLFSSRAPIGYCVIANNDVCTNQGFKSVVPNILETNEFIYYFLKVSVEEIRGRASGTTFKEISGAEFGRTLIPLPPLAEQKRIVAAIEAAFEQLDMIAENISG